MKKASVKMGTREDDMATLRILKKMKKICAIINRRMIAEMYNTNEIFSSNIHEEIPITVPYALCF